MSNHGKYVGLGSEGSSSDTPFPTETNFNVKELIFLRSWQAPGFVRALYYFSFLVGLMYFIQTIVVYTQAYGAGGFFLGLLYGSIQFIAFILGARIVSEVVLSIFVIRDNTYRAASNSGPPIVSHSASSSTYQGTYQQPIYQPPQQQNQSYQHQPQQQQQQPASQSEFPKYQEPYQGSL